MDRRHVWRATLGELELSLSQATFSTWFRRTALLRVDDATHTFVIGVASGFAKDWIEDRYRTLIAQTLAKTVGYSVTVQVEVVGDAALDEAGAAPAASTAAPATQSDDAARRSGMSNDADTVRIVDDARESRPSELNPRYTFATYVVGAEIGRAHV